MDEEELLLETSSTFDVANLGELDESAILGDDDCQEEGSIKDEMILDEAHEETEELDYDEDLEAEKAPRSSKFTSERALLQRHSSQNDVASKNDDRNRCEISSNNNNSGNKFMVETAVVKEENSIAVSSSQIRSSESVTKVTAPTKRTSRVFINPHHKSVIKPQASLSLPWQAVAPIKVPSVPNLRSSMAIAPTQNSTVAMLPQLTNSLNFPIVASSSADFSRPPPQIMPLPNYSTPPPPSIYPNQFMAESISQIPSAGQWDQMVEGFLRRTTARSRSRFSRSSRSSFSSSRSRSRSYSSHSSSSTASSRSSTRSPYRRVHSRSRRSTSRRSFNYRSRNDVNRRRPSDRSRQLRDGGYHSERNRGRGNDAAKQEKTIECAKAIGLDSEYLTKLEEQKKMREEILRKKEERRIQTVQRLGGSLPVSNSGKSVRQLSSRGGAGGGGGDGSGRRLTDGSSRSSRKRDFDSHNRNRGTDEIRKNDKMNFATSGAVSSSRTNVKTDSRRGAITTGRMEVVVRGETAAVSSNSNMVRRMEPTTIPISGIHNSQLQALAVTTVPSPAPVPVPIPVPAPAIRHPAAENQQHFPEKGRKKKAYLAVVVSSSNQAPIDMERIGIIAETIGPTKKVWKSAENTVSLIFEQHESAKKFMFHYHSRVINGVQLVITLQKLFANLAELP